MQVISRGFLLCRAFSRSPSFSDYFSNVRLSKTVNRSFSSDASAQPESVAGLKVRPSEAACSEAGLAGTIPTLPLQIRATTTANIESRVSVPTEKPNDSLPCAPLGLLDRLRVFIFPHSGIQSFVEPAELRIIITTHTQHTGSTYILILYNLNIHERN